MTLIKLASLGLMASPLGAHATAQLAAAPAATASTAMASTGSAGGFFQVLLGLIAVLSLMAVSAWLLKKFGATSVAGNATVKIVGGVSVGNRERVLVVEVGDQWIVVGVAAGQVNALSTMPRQEVSARPESAPELVTKNFSAWLKQTIEKRNGS